MMKLLGKGHDPKFWEHVRESDVFSRYRDELHEYWNETGKDLVFTSNLYSKWKLYFTTGNRIIYEDDYFEKRNFIEFVTLLALIYPEREEYLEKLQNAIFAVLDEYTWCLPAHQGQNERSNVCRIDLFNAETALTFSVVYTLLKDRLDPLILDRIRTEVDRRVIYPFLAPDFSEWWEGFHNNWCSVCTGSVGCAMMLMHPELCSEDVLLRLVRSMNGYISGFEDDGVCTEGCSYWNYGVGFFVIFADMLKEFTDGKMNLFDDPKLKAIAQFPQHIFLSGQSGASFADSPCSINYKFGVLHRLKREFPDDIIIYSPDYGVFNDECGRLILRLTGATYLDENTYMNPADGTAEFENFAANAAWITKRTRSYGFAAKAGHNDELHNHNDVGTFIYAKNGRHILTDVGSGSYTAQYFGDQRYDIFEPSSRSHSVPIIDGKYQLAGKEHAASDVVYEKGMFSADISGAYGAPELKSLKRSFTMYDDCVVLNDSYSLASPVSITERFVTDIKPEHLGKGRIRLSDCIITYDPDVCTYKETVESGTRGSDNKHYLLDLTLNEGCTDFTLKIQ